MEIQDIFGQLSNYNLDLNNFSRSPISEENKDATLKETSVNIWREI